MNPLVDAATLCHSAIWTVVSKYNAWRRLSRRERWDFVAAAIANVLILTSLRLLGVRRAMSWVKRQASARSAIDTPAVVLDIAEAVNRVERHSPIPGTCLSRSLTLQWLLARRGIDSVIRFGGRILNSQFEGHAWVERDGVVIGSPSDVVSRFVPFESAATSSSLSPVSDGGVSPP